MAKTVSVTITDDIDGTPISEDDFVATSFSLNGTEYTIDLSPENQRRFAETMLPYTKAASTRTKTAKKPSKQDMNAEVSPNAIVREWAKKQGYEVSDRGRLPGNIMDAYYDAHQEI